MTYVFFYAYCMSTVVLISQANVHVCIRGYMYMYSLLIEIFGPVLLVVHFWASLAYRNNA